MLFLIASTTLHNCLSIGSAPCFVWGSSNEKQKQSLENHNSSLNLFDECKFVSDENIFQNFDSLTFFLKKAAEHNKELIISAVLHDVRCNIILTTQELKHQCANDILSIYERNNNHQKAYNMLLIIASLLGAAEWWQKKYAWYDEWDSYGFTFSEAYTNAAFEFATARKNYKLLECFCNLNWFLYSLSDETLLRSVTTAVNNEDADTIRFFANRGILSQIETRLIRTLSQTDNVEIKALLAPYKWSLIEKLKGF